LEIQDDLSQALYFPGTTLAIQQILQEYNIKGFGKEAVILGNSYSIGFPISVLLSKLGYSVTTIDRGCQDRDEFIKEADLVISATGVPRLVDPSNLKDGSVLINIGFCMENGKLVEDICSESAMQKCSLVAEANGGVGPINCSFIIRKVVRGWAMEFQHLAKDGSELSL